MIWIRKIKDENGSYVDCSEVRWIIEWCNKIYCPRGLSEEEHGYERFDSMGSALLAWGLTPWVDPEHEELLINDFTEND